VDEKPFTFRSGAYVVHEVFIRRAESGDFSCVVELEVAGAILRRVMILIAMDAAPVVFEVWSAQADAPPYWYGFPTEEALLDGITEAALSI
jgi:hypothetical protein